MRIWVFVDVDGTLIDQWDTPRPYVRELIEALRRLDVNIVVWSAGGHKYAEDKLHIISRKINFDLSGYIDAYWWKAWQGMIVLNKTKFYIDDASELLKAREAEGHGTFKVPFYRGPSKKDDKWLLKAIDAVKTFVEANQEASKQ